MDHPGEPLHPNDCSFEARKKCPIVSRTQVNSLTLTQFWYHYRLCLHLQNRTSAPFCVLCELPNKDRCARAFVRAFVVRACVRVCVCVCACELQKRWGIAEDRKKWKRLTPKGCQAFLTFTARLFILVCRAGDTHTHTDTRARTHEGESQAKAHTLKHLPSGARYAHTSTESLVGNEGLKSESIMNIPSGGSAATSREPGIRR